MQLPLSWIEEFVTAPVGPTKLAQLLTFSGTEVERLEQRHYNNTKVVVGQIKTIVKHPGADRLNVTKVVIQEGQEKPLTIVCGGPNIKPGMKVPVAIVGAKLANGLEIKRAPIRGVESEGMLCAADELGLSEDHSGVMVLSPDIPLGMTLEKALALDETILHLELTPNRADCFSVLGIAREVSVLTKRPLYQPDPKLKEGKLLASKSIKVTIRDKTMCSRFVARYVKNVTVKPSPQWLVNRLEAAGIRAINNVVDVTNYVMLELGQPLHAYDARQVRGKHLIIRRARKGEKLTLLDGTTPTLTADMPVVADSARALCLAGIMGGEASGVSEKTKDVIIESATFDPVAIRKTASALGLRTEGSHRHEKGPDSALVAVAADRAAELLVQVAGGEIQKGTVDAGKSPTPRKAIQFSLAEAESLLGVTLGEKKAVDMLIRLGCAVERKGTDWRVTPPTWRGDLMLPVDLAEELGRLTDYNTFPKTNLTGVLTPQPLPTLLALEWKARRYFSTVGFSEVLTYPYYGQPARDQFGLAKPHIEPIKPLSPDQQFLRQSLTPRLVEGVAKNLGQTETIQLFEIGSLFFPAAKTPTEWRSLGAVILAKDAYRRVRGVLEDFAVLGNLQLTASVKGNVATFTVAKEIVATITAYSPEAVRAFKIRSNDSLAALELNLTVLTKHWKHEQTFKVFSQFPAVKRDLAFWLPKSQPIESVLKALQAIDPLVTQVELFDVFDKDNRRSYAVHLTFQTDRTLTADEVQAILARAHTVLKQQFKAELRD